MRSYEAVISEIKLHLNNLQTNVSGYLEELEEQSDPLCDKKNDLKDEQEKLVDRADQSKWMVHHLEKEVKEVSIDMQAMQDEY